MGTNRRKMREGALPFHAFKSDVYDNNVMIMILSFLFQYNNVTVISPFLPHVRRQRNARADFACVMPGKRSEKRRKKCCVAIPTIEMINYLGILFDLLCLY
jgi:hypothetical protein